MLISFEGIDGSGKSTQIQLLQGYYHDIGAEINLFREPGGTSISESIRAILLDSKLTIDPVTELLLFSSARSQLVAEKVQPLLNDGQIVVLDRFYDSTLAYQGYGRKSIPIEEIHQINHIASHGLEPNITFYLRLTQDQAKSRMRGLQKDRMELAGDEFFERVIEGYDLLAKTNTRFRVIDATLPPEEIHQQIVELLNQHPHPA